MHLYLFVQPAFHLHPQGWVCSAACVKDTKAIQALIAPVVSFSATSALQLLPVELHGTRGMCARVV
jgi:hypothetical protein